MLLEYLPGRKRHIVKKKEKEKWPLEGKNILPSAQKYGFPGNFT